MLRLCCKCWLLVFVFWKPQFLTTQLYNVGAIFEDLWNIVVRGTFCASCATGWFTLSQVHKRHLLLTFKNRWSASSISWTVNLTLFDCTSLCFVLGSAVVHFSFIECFQINWSTCTGKYKQNFSFIEFSNKADSLLLGSVALRFMGLFSANERVALYWEAYKYTSALSSFPTWTDSSLLGSVKVRFSYI